VVTSEHPPQQAPRLPTAAAAIALLRNSLARTHPPDRSPPSPTAHAHNCSSRCGKNRQTPSFLQGDSDCACTLRLARTDDTMGGVKFSSASSRLDGVHPVAPRPLVAAVVGHAHMPWQDRATTMQHVEAIQQRCPRRVLTENAAVSALPLVQSEAWLVS
jgi:hypothetical protein